MVLGYTMIGAVIGLVSSAVAYFALDLTMLAALAVYSSVGVGTVALAAFAVAFRPEDATTLETRAARTQDWRQKETV